jgi:metal-responsive CopG/Arc/MetJ family transcriptional regulator
MRTIQMTLDDDLVLVVDRISKHLGTTRSAFTRTALREALSRYNVEQL